MNRTIKEATVRRFHYDSHQQLEAHLADFVSAYNFARRLKTLRGSHPTNSSAKIWTKEPKRFRLDPLHQMPGLNNSMQTRDSDLGKTALACGATIWTGSATIRMKRQVVAIW